MLLLGFLQFDKSAKLSIILDGHLFFRHKHWQQL
jgi:hypothetical protein